MCLPESTVRPRAAVPRRGLILVCFAPPVKWCENSSGGGWLARNPPADFGFLTVRDQRLDATVHCRQDYCNEEIYASIRDMKLAGNSAIPER